MVSTVEEIVKFLETCCQEDLINIGKFTQYIEARKVSASDYYYYVANKRDKWDVIQFDTGMSKVSEVLEFLKSHLPEHKDKHIAVHDKEKGKIVAATSKFETVVMHRFDFTKGITELPKIKFEETDKLWKEFSDEIQKIKDSSSGLDLLPIAQYLLISKPGLKEIFCVENVFYRTFGHVVIDYSELTEKDKTDLFDLKNSVYVCKISKKELKAVSKMRKNPKYVVNDDTMPLEELLKLYTLSESQIAKLFKLDSHKFVCDFPDILSAFKK